ncbi:UNVERIFIED_CONTAM: hypothetical protein HHA_213920 [Hammondia hammondi]|eukprot:XP_008884058.1 hypothetical protein HHA_213920 [Hammondia hammondi]
MTRAATDASENVILQTPLSAEARALRPPGVCPRTRGVSTPPARAVGHRLNQARPSRLSRVDPQSPAHLQSGDFRPNFAAEQSTSEEDAGVSRDCLAEGGDFHEIQSPAGAPGADPCLTTADVSARATPPFPGEKKPQKSCSSLASAPATDAALLPLPEVLRAAGWNSCVFDSKHAHPARPALGRATAARAAARAEARAEAAARNRLQRTPENGGKTGNSTGKASLKSAGGAAKPPAARPVSLLAASPGASATSRQSLRPPSSAPGRSVLPSSRSKEAGEDEQEKSSLEGNGVAFGRVATERDRGPGRVSRHLEGERKRGPEEKRTPGKGGDGVKAKTRERLRGQRSSSGAAKGDTAEKADGVTDWRLEEIRPATEADVRAAKRHALAQDLQLLSRDCECGAGLSLWKFYENEIERDRRRIVELETLTKALERRLERATTVFRCTDTREAVAGLLKAATQEEVCSIMDKHCERTSGEGEEAFQERTTAEGEEMESEEEREMHDLFRRMDGDANSKPRREEAREEAASRSAGLPAAVVAETLRTRLAEEEEKTQADLSAVERIEAEAEETRAQTRKLKEEEHALCQAALDLSEEVQQLEEEVHLLRDATGGQSHTDNEFEQRKEALTRRREALCLHREETRATADSLTAKLRAAVEELRSFLENKRSHRDGDAPACLSEDATPQESNATFDLVDEQENLDAQLEAAKAEEQELDEAVKREEARLGHLRRELRRLEAKRDSCEMSEREEEREDGEGEEEREDEEGEGEQEREDRVKTLAARHEELLARDEELNLVRTWWLHYAVQQLEHQREQAEKARQRHISQLASLRSQLFALLRRKGLTLPDVVACVSSLFPPASPLSGSSFPPPSPVEAFSTASNAPTCELSSPDSGTFSGVTKTSQRPERRDTASQRDSQADLHPTPENDRSTDFCLPENPSSSSATSSSSSFASSPSSSSSLSSVFVALPEDPLVGLTTWIPQKTGVSSKARCGATRERQLHASKRCLRIPYAVYSASVTRGREAPTEESERDRNFRESAHWGQRRESVKREKEDGEVKAAEERGTTQGTKGREAEGRSDLTEQL